jgi:hypothetical protein
MAGERFRKKSLSCYANQMNTTENTVQMNYCCWIIRIRCYHPQSSSLAGPGINLREPLDQRTGIRNPTMLEGQEPKHTSNVQALEALLVLIMLGDDTIVPRRAITPRRGRAYNFLVHAADSREVAWCVIGCNGRGIHMNLPSKRFHLLYCSEVFIHI